MKVKTSRSLDQLLNASSLEITYAVLIVASLVVGYWAGARPRAKQLKEGASNTSLSNEQPELDDCKLVTHGTSLPTSPLSFDASNDRCSLCGLTWGCRLEKWLLSEISSCTAIYDISGLTHFLVDARAYLDC